MQAFQFKCMITLHMWKYEGGRMVIAIFRLYIYIDLF